MCKIMISMKKPVENTKFIFELKKIDAHWSIESLKNNLKKGANGFFFCCELFLNDHKEKDKQIRGILALAKKYGYELHIVEIPYNKNWTDFSIEQLNTDCAITDDALLNILNEAEDDFS